MSSVKIITANKSNKQALDEWDDFLQSLRNSTPVDIHETTALKAKRVAKLEGDFEEWVKYYFPKYCFAPAAAFQRKSSQRIFKAEKHFYQRRAWARGLAKSTRRMMEVFYLMFARKLRINALLLSKTNENAVRLLGTYMANLQANNRFIHDYGIQEKPGSWAADEFTTRGGCTFRAVGAGQNPRGAKNEELRINVLIFDDIDDDEVCRSPERLDNTWNWIEQAVIPCVDISKLYYIFFDNNVIAEDSIAVRAAAMANDVETVNIRDDNGASVWPEKNSEADIDYMLSIISYESGQKEYYNNPISAGKVFKELTYGKCPPLKELPFVVLYADPSPSNKDKPTAKAKLQNSCKAAWLMGYKDGKYYVYKGFVDVTTNATFVDWLYHGRDYVADKTVLYAFVENNGLQNPFYEQVLLPMIHAKGKEPGVKGVLGITPDDREKPDKYFRIEGTLEPLNRMGLLVFNIDEKDDPHMKRLEAQFKSVSPNSKTMDGPDAVEGGVFKIQQKLTGLTPGSIIMHRRVRNQSKSF